MAACGLFGSYFPGVWASDHFASIGPLALYLCSPPLSPALLRPVIPNWLPAAAVANATADAAGMSGSPLQPGTRHTLRDQRILQVPCLSARTAPQPTPASAWCTEVSDGHTASASVAATLPPH